SIIGGSAPKKFGIDMQDIDAACRAALALPNISLSGFHVFNASQVLDWRMFSDNIERVITMATDLAARLGVPIRSLDIGGGLGKPYMPEESELDVEKVGAHLTGLLQKTFGDAPPRVIVEPGRYLSGESGLYLVSVIDKKQVGGKEFLITDGGIHQLL